MGENEKSRRKIAREAFQKTAVEIFDSGMADTRSIILVGPLENGASVLRGQLHNVFSMADARRFYGKNSPLCKAICEAFKVDPDLNILAVGM